MPGLGVGSAHQAPRRRHQTLVQPEAAQERALMLEFRGRGRELYFHAFPDVDEAAAADVAPRPETATADVLAPAAAAATAQTIDGTSNVADIDDAVLRMAQLTREDAELLGIEFTLASIDAARALGRSARLRKNVSFEK